MILPVKNVSRCLSLFIRGLKNFIPFRLLPFAKCFMNVASTRCISFISCDIREARENTSVKTEPKL